MRPLLLLALFALPLSGCLDTVLGEVVLPKTLDLQVRYEGSEGLDGVTYSVQVADPEGALLIDESGVLEPGTEVQLNTVFEFVGPYTLTVDISHPSGFDVSRSLTWDFNIICRDVDHLAVAAVFEDDGIEWEATDTGSVVCI